MSLTVFSQGAIPLQLTHMKQYLMFHCAPCSTVTQVTLLIDARHRSNLLDVREFGGANVDSDHYLIGSKIQARIARSRLEKGA
jgi:hypothetical protein